MIAPVNGNLILTRALERNLEKNRNPCQLCDVFSEKVGQRLRLARQGQSFLQSCSFYNHSISGIGHNPAGLAIWPRQESKIKGFFHICERIGNTMNTSRRRDLRLKTSSSRTTNNISVRAKCLGILLPIRPKAVSRHGYFPNCCTSRHG